MFFAHSRKGFAGRLIYPLASEGFSRSAELSFLEKATTPPAVNLLLRGVGREDCLTAGGWGCSVGGNRFPPKLKVLASAPSTDPLFNVGGEIPLVAFSSSLGRP